MKHLYLAAFLLTVSPFFAKPTTPLKVPSATPFMHVEKQKRNDNPEKYLSKRLPRGNGRYHTFRSCLKLLNQRNIQTIIETGTARCGDENFDGDGGSTILFAHWAKDHDAMLFSVDNNAVHIARAKEAVTEYASNIEFVLEDSVRFLEEFPGQIDFLYLDSYDFDEENPGPPQKHALREIMAAYDKLSKHAIVMIDDCNIPHGGKGKLAIKFLKEKGWYLKENRHQVILLRKS